MATVVSTLLQINKILVSTVTQKVIVFLHIKKKKISNKAKSYWIHCCILLRQN